MTLKIGLLRLARLRSRKKKNEEKLTDPKGPVEQYQAHQHPHNGSSIMRGKKEKVAERKFEEIMVKNLHLGASLVAQWLRVCLPVQGTRVRALVWEDPTCRGATGPVSHGY